MVILQIIYNLAPGGAERFVVDLCNELSHNNNDEIHLLTTNTDEIPNNKHYLEHLLPNVHYRNLGAKSGFSFKSIWGVYKMIKEIKPDIVHLHSNLILLFPPAFLCRNVNFIHTLHTLAEKTVTIKALKPAYRYLYKKKVQPVTISSQCDRSYIEFYGMRNSIHIDNGRSPIETTQELNSVYEEIKKYTNNKDIPIYIHVARYAEPKNQKLLFDTFNRLHDNGKEFLLIVLGSGFERSPYMHLNETSHIKILGAKQNVGDYLACADYFVLSSLYEGLPISLLEAMSMGCIPISTPAGGVVDVIRNGENGLISPSFTEDDFYNTVNKSFGKITIKKDDIKENYRNNYTIEVCTNKYYETYLNILNRKS